MTKQALTRTGGLTLTTTTTRTDPVPPDLSHHLSSSSCQWIDGGDGVAYDGVA